MTAPVEMKFLNLLLAGLAILILTEPRKLSAQAPPEYKGKMCDFTDINTFEDKSIPCDELFKGVDKLRNMTDKERFLATCTYSERDFSVEDFPVSRKRSVTVILKTEPNCSDSIVRLYCYGGSCQAYPSGGQYGFSPVSTSRMAIDKRKWTWRGDHPDWVGFEMWRTIRNGSRIAYELSWWVDSYPTGTEKIYITKDLKNKIYKMSLFQP